MFSKFLGHSQNFTDTIWIVLGLYFFSRILYGFYFGTKKNEKWIVGPLGQAVNMTNFVWAQ